MLIPRIGSIIKEKGLMQKFVAEKMGVSPQQLSKWVNGKGAYPQADVLWELASLLGCKVDDLYTYDEKE